MAVATTNPSDDLRLLDLLKQGNELAFKKIYDSYWERLFAYTYNRLHIREASEEVVQDVFFSLWAKRESVIISSSLSAWLYGATRHRLLNELRAAKVRAVYASNYAAFIKHLYDNSNLEHQEVTDLLNSIEASVSELPKKCQAVFRLSRLEHIPNTGIAEKLNISTKTVENYLTQALKHIRTSLGQLLLFLILTVL